MKTDLWEVIVLWNDEIIPQTYRDEKLFVYWITILRISVALGLLATGVSLTRSLLATAAHFRKALPKRRSKQYEQLAEIKELLQQPSTATLQQPAKPSKIFDFLECFSWPKSMQTLLELNKPEHELDALNGIKWFCCVSIIIFHCTFTHDDPNASYKKDAYYDYQVGNLGQIVDIFFWISGLVNYVSLSSKYKTSKNRVVTMILSYPNRVLRLYPTCLMCMLYLWKVNPYIGAQYPTFNESKSLRETGIARTYCPLGINILNEIPFDECYPVSWYIRVDLLLYIGTPILALLGSLMNPFVSSLACLLAMYCSHFACLGYAMGKQVHFSDWTTSNNPYPDSHTPFLMFFRTWQMRLTSYLFGCFIGSLYVLYKQFAKQQLRTLLQSLAWPIIVACYTLGYLQFCYPQLDAIRLMVDSRAYTSEFHCDYLCERLTILLLPSLLGIRNPVGSVLSWKPFQLLAKFSFSIYLVHLPIIYLMFIEHFKATDTSIRGLAIRVYEVEMPLILQVSFLLMMLIEQPIGNLCKFVGIG